MNNFQDLNIDPSELVRELTFKATRSQGKGGQNVNKVSTKIVLIFDLENSKVLDSDVKITIRNKLGKRIDSKGKLQLSVSKERSQYMNKSLAIKKFLQLIEKSLEKEEERIATKPSRKSKEKRLFDKSILSQKKQLRKVKYKIEE